MNEPPITDYLAAWRVASLGDREILEGIVAPPHDAGVRRSSRARSPRGMQGAGGGTHYWDAYRGNRWLVLVREFAAAAGALVATRAAASRSRSSPPPPPAPRSRASPSGSAT